MRMAWPVTKLAELNEREAKARKELDRLQESQERVHELAAKKSALLIAHTDDMLYNSVRDSALQMRREIYETMRLSDRAKR